MEKIKRFFECLIPVTTCNIKCEYCYVIQECRRTMQSAVFMYSSKQTIKALSKERLGGVCYFSICGAGETMLPHQSIEITRELLNEGHYVNLTTNGTLSKRFQELINACDSECLRRLHFAFSFHYLELKRLNLVENFFENINLVKAAGCSFVVQINLYDGYIPHLDEIEKLCVAKVGAVPQVAVTRLESSQGVKMNDIRLHTKGNTQTYIDYGKIFQSPLFDFTMKNFMVPRTEFCYAGDWSGCLNLATGILTACYASNRTQNIFQNTDKPIYFCAVGKCCALPYCINSSHFMSLGVIPELRTPSYAELRNRKEARWYGNEMERFLSSKLSEANVEYSGLKKWYVTVYNRICNILNIKQFAIKLLPQKVKKLIKKVIRNKQ